MKLESGRQPDVFRQMQNMQDQIDSLMKDSVFGGSFVTSLPKDGLFHGRHIFFQVSEGIIWHFIYNAFSTSPYRWEFVGGTDLYLKRSNVVSAPSGSGNWDNITSGTPCQVTCPLAGEYDFWFHASGQEDLGGTPSGDVYISLHDDGAVVTTESEAWHRATVAYHKWSIMNTAKLTVGAGSVMQTRGKIVSASWNNYRWYSADIRARPIRVG